MVDAYLLVLLHMPSMRCFFFEVLRFFESHVLVLNILSYIFDN